MQCLWKESTVSRFFNQLGKLFQMIGPEYIKLCLKSSFCGLGVEKLIILVDRSHSIVSFMARRENI